MTVDAEIQGIARRIQERHDPEQLTRREVFSAMYDMQDRADAAIRERNFGKAGEWMLKAWPTDSRPPCSPRTLRKQFGYGKAEVKNLYSAYEVAFEQHATTSQRADRAKDEKTWRAVKRTVAAVAVVATGGISAALVWSHEKDASDSRTTLQRLNARSESYATAHGIAEPPIRHSFGHGNRVDLFPNAAITTSTENGLVVGVIDGLAFETWLRVTEGRQPLVAEPFKCGNGIAFLTSSHIFIVNGQGNQVGVTETHYSDAHGAPELSCSRDTLAIDFAP